MIIIAEGVDRVGKDTQILKIKRYFEEKGHTFHVLHYSNIKGNDIEKRSRKYYQEMFSICSLANFNNINLILNRAHIGEAVYSPLYRNYNGDYVFNYENKIEQDKFILFVFIDNAENLIVRDDGFSFSKELEKKQDEIDRFKIAFDKSNIKNKFLINIDKKNIDMVFEEVKNCIQKTLKL